MFSFRIPKLAALFRVFSEEGSFPPPPDGFAYLVDSAGRFLTDSEGRFLLSELPI